MDRTEATVEEVKEGVEQKTLPLNAYDYTDLDDLDDEDDDEVEPEPEPKAEKAEKAEKVEPEEEPKEHAEEKSAPKGEGSEQTEGQGQSPDIVASILEAIPELEDPDDLGEDIKGFHSAVKDGFKKMGEVIKELQEKNQRLSADAQSRQQDEAVRELDDCLADMPEYHHVLGATRSERMKDSKLKDAVGQRLIPRIQSIAREHQEAGRPVPSLKELTREAAESLFHKKNIRREDVENLKRKRTIAVPDGSNSNRKLSGKDRALQRSRDLDRVISDDDVGGADGF